MVAELDVVRHVELVDDETKALMAWAIAVAESDDTYFRKGLRMARRLGAHYRADGLTEVGFWTPGLAGEIIQSDRQIYLEVFTPQEPIDFRQPEQMVQFSCDRIPLAQQGEYVWGVISGMKAGTRDQAGSFYWLRYQDEVQGRMRIIPDPIPYSLPYGVFAPAELYNVDALQADRSDMPYFQHTGVLVDPDQLPVPLISEAEEGVEIPRIPSPVNILQIHARTASPDGTLESLTALYRSISEKLAKGEALTPFEENYVGYDAIQFLPLEPTIEYRIEGDNAFHEFFAIASSWDELAQDTSLTQQPVQITLRKPDTQNWGYDVPIAGSSATNPALLGSLRPDEMLDLVAELHNFSQGPIQVIYDLVYGHADNQSLDLLSRQYLKGPNMYGQDLNHQLPMVRAILLEMQRRKINTGADGIRVDGGQDFRFFNPLSGRVEQDDAYLLAMSDLVQEVNGYHRLMFTIFEDGRPWPQEGWEETSTYRDLIELRPESYQWGPLIFAHNTPTLKGFWDKKWRRVSEVMFQGDRWITGCANHDTIRRGTQVSPNESINWNFGETLPDVLHNAYDNPATLLWVYGFSPGLPMDFINALTHAPWGFFRNTDDRYGVKVASEEAGFLDWQVEPDSYLRDDSFTRLKALGFFDLKQLRRFMNALQIAMLDTDYDLEKVVNICQQCLGSETGACELIPMKELNTSDKPEFISDLDVSKLKSFAMAFMEDSHDFCNVTHYAHRVQPERSRFNRTLRDYRRANPWLGENLSGTDRFNRITDETHTLFYGVRTDPHHHTPETAKQVAMVTHMGGEPLNITLGDWLQLDLAEWRVAIATPGLELGDTVEDLRCFELQDGQGVLLEHYPVAKNAEPEQSTTAEKPSSTGKNQTTTTPKETNKPDS